MIMITDSMCFFTPSLLLCWPHTNCFIREKSRIRETKHLLTAADSSTDAIGGWTKNTQKPNFFEKRKKSPKTQKLRNVQKYDKISDTLIDQRSLIHREAWFPPCFVGQRIPLKPIFFEKKKKIIQNAKTQKRLEICQNQRYALRPEVSEVWFPGGSRKTEKIIQNAKTQKYLEICQNQRYTLRPEVYNPSGSVVSTMFCKAKSAKKLIFFCAAILDNFQTKMFKCETTSFHYFSPRIPKL